MYNGIGLTTARGSGTNGYVQRNMATVRTTKERVKYKTEEELKKIDSAAIKQPNQEILDHERKRKIELKCMELQEMMEDKGYSKEEIGEKVVEFRQMLMEKDVTDNKSSIVLDENGRPIVRETHQLAEANMAKNSKLREAFGISQYFVEGSSLDPARKAKEALAKSEAAQARKLALTDYAVVNFSESESEVEVIEVVTKVDKRKKKKKEASSSEEEEDSPSPPPKRQSRRKRKSTSPESLPASPKRSKKKSSKRYKSPEIKEIKKDKRRPEKHRRERSESPVVRKSKTKSKDRNRRRSPPEKKTAHRKRQARHDSSDESLSSNYSID